MRRLPVKRKASKRGLDIPFIMKIMKKINNHMGKHPLWYAVLFLIIGIVLGFIINEIYTQVFGIRIGGAFFGWAEDHLVIKVN